MWPCNKLEKTEEDTKGALTQAYRPPFHRKRLQLVLEFHNQLVSFQLWQNYEADSC